jgi:hypothetical protein
MPAFYRPWEVVEGRGDDRPGGNGGGGVSSKHQPFRGRGNDGIKHHFGDVEE